jgi:hypothetical protein
MTDRHCAYIVVLDKSVREDDAEANGVLNAIRRLKGVAGVDPVVDGGDMGDQVAQARAKQTLGVRCIEAVTRAVYDEPDRTL